jgi:hypothetical protein
MKNISKCAHITLVSLDKLCLFIDTEEDKLFFQR